jgi:arsenite methyltransferase
MSASSNDQVRQAVRESYGQVAVTGSSCCGTASCCCPTDQEPQLLSIGLGYSTPDVVWVPDGSNLGLGCGNPQAIAALVPGEVVLDLGSEAGFDCFLAAAQVGPEGHVIGVDMTPEMVTKARGNAAKGGYANLDFRLGEIEHLPVADDSVDVIISNCVINLSPDKPAVFREAFRVLRPGGRLAISDVVALVAVPEEARNDLAMLSACVSGAEEVRVIEQLLLQTGFEQVHIGPKDDSLSFITDRVSDSSLTDPVRSASIEARKPERQP